MCTDDFFVNLQRNTEKVLDFSYLFGYNNINTNGPLAQLVRATGS